MVSINDSLIQKGLIKTVHVDRRKLFELTEEGREAALKASLSLPGKHGRGGIEHDYWVAQTIRFLRKLEFQPVMEFSGIDLVDLKSGLAIEIETGKSDIKKNLVKLEKTNVSHPYVLATRKQVVPKIIDLAIKHPSIKVLFIKDFLKLSKRELTSKTAFDKPSKDITKSNRS